MNVRQMMKCLVAILLLCMTASSVMAQKNIDKLVEELEKSDETAINSVTKRDPKTRKIVRVIKTFSLKDIKMAKRLIAAFEKDEEYAVSAIKDMPKGRKNPLKVNFTFIYDEENSEKSIYTLSTGEDGTVSLSINIRRSTGNGKDFSFMMNDDFNVQVQDLVARTDELGCLITNDERLRVTVKSIKDQVAKIKDQKECLILEGDVVINNKKMKKGNYTIDGRKVIVR